MIRDVINFRDLAIAREIIPFLRLRLRILREGASYLSNGKPQSTLIVTPCIVGDCLSYLPAIEAFAEEHLSTYDIVVSPDFRPLARRLRSCRRVLVANNSYSSAKSVAGRGEDVADEYDLIIVLRLSHEAFNLVKYIKCRRLISSELVLLKYIYSMSKCSLLKQPVVQSRDIMFDVLNVKARNYNGSPPELFNLTDYDPARLEELDALQGSERKILIHTGSGWPVKLWSDDRWIGLLEKIKSRDDCRFIFVGKGDEELTAYQRIADQLGFKVYSLINELDLWELFMVMKRSDLFIGVDSGPRNLAHYADLRSLTLLNPAAAKNFMPFDERDILVEHQNRFPANIVNTRRGANLLVIGVDEVFEAYLKLIA